VFPAGEVLMSDDAFICRLLDRHDDELMQIVIIRNDTQWFCNAMQELVMQIREWLRGSGISVSARAVFHADRSVRLWPGSPPACYDIIAASLKKAGVTAGLCPVSVYGEAGARGVARLSVTGAGTRRKDFRLTLSRETSCWTIRHEDDPPRAAVPLCRDAVIAAISGSGALKKRSAGG